MERKTVKKWYWAWDFEKEERWLNQMAESGWVLDGVGFATYHFVKCEPGEYTVRLEMRDHDEAYLQLMAESGAEYVGRVMKWIYFRKKSEHGGFNIFSDLDSRIDHIKKISTMVGTLTGANFCIGIANSINVTHIGWLNLTVCVILAYGLGRLHELTERLQRDRQLME